MDIRILIGVIIALACEPHQPLEPPTMALCLSWLAANMLGLAAYALVARTVLASLTRRGASPRKLVRWHGWFLRCGGVLWLVAYVAIAFFGPWPDLVAGWVNPDFQLPFHSLVMVPLLVTLPLLWLGNYLCTQVLRRSPSALAGLRLTDDFTLLRYLVFQLRQNLLIILIPYVVLLGAQDLANQAAGGHLQDRFQMLTAIVTVAFIYLLSPLMLRYVWRTRPLPAGPLRQGLELAAARAGVPVANIFVWQTGGFLVNACVAGVLRPLRYVFLTDTLIDNFHPTQVEAVFGHELGHARHHHIVFYSLFGAGAGLLAILLTLLLQRTDLPADWADWVAGAASVLYWGLFFGFLSRRFEWQSDLLGARLVVCPGETQPGLCAYHGLPAAPADSAALLPETPPAGLAPGDPDLICPTKAYAFTSSLDRIAALNGISPKARSWRHGSIASRIDFVAGMIGRPDQVRRYDRRMRMFKIGLLAVAAALATTVVLHYYLLR